MYGTSSIPTLDNTKLKKYKAEVKKKYRNCINKNDKCNCQDMMDIDTEVSLFSILKCIEDEETSRTMRSKNTPRKKGNI